MGVPAIPDDAVQEPVEAPEGFREGDPVPDWDFPPEPVENPDGF